MTDKQIFTDLLTRNAIEWNDSPEDDDNVVLIEAKTGPHNLGYLGFVAVFFFNQEDRLVDVGIWE